MRNTKFKGLLAGATVGALMAFSGGAASAATINIVSNSDEPGLSGSIVINLASDQSSITLADQYLFDVTVTNNGGFDNSSITAFSLVSTPTSTYEEDTSTRFSFGEASYAFGGGQNFSTFDFCLESDTNDQCNGGSTSTGVTVGFPHTFTLTVSTATSAGAPDFFGGALRWQGVGNGDDTSLSAYGECTSDCGNGGVTPPPIPLPAGLPLILTGLGVFGALRLRNRKSA